MKRCISKKKRNVFFIYLPIRANEAQNRILLLVQNYRCSTIVCPGWTIFMPLFGPEGLWPTFSKYLYLLPYRLHSSSYFSCTSCSVKYFTNHKSTSSPRNKNRTLVFGFNHSILAWYILVSNCNKYFKWRDLVVIRNKSVAIYKPFRKSQWP